MLLDLLQGKYMNYEIECYRMAPSDQLHKELVEAYRRQLALYYPGYTAIIKTLTNRGQTSMQVLYFTKEDFETAVVPVVLASWLKVDTSERLTFEPGTDCIGCMAQLIVWGHLQSDASIINECTQKFKFGWVKDLQSYKTVIEQAKNAQSVIITDTLYYPEVSDAIHKLDIHICSNLGSDQDYILVISTKNIATFRDQLEATLSRNAMYAFLPVQ